MEVEGGANWDEQTFQSMKDEARGTVRWLRGTWSTALGSVTVLLRTKLTAARAAAEVLGLASDINTGLWKGIATKLGGCWEDRRNGSRMQSEGTRDMILKCWDAY